MDFRFLTLFLLFLTGSPTLQAHPHIFITVSLQPVIEQETLKGFKMKWVWDKWWSEDVINSCDNDKNGVFDEKENSQIFKDFFDGIKDYNYFTEISIDGKKIKTGLVKKLSATMEKSGQVSYSFFLPAEVPISKKTKIKLVFNDETIYTAFDKNVLLIQKPGIEYNNPSYVTSGYYGVQVTFQMTRP